jgi:4a-hydroxytetrahydrobiopterin dehydratase
MPAVQALPEPEINQRLLALPNWAYLDISGQEKYLQRVYAGKTYLSSLEMLTRIGHLAEAENHHPDLLLHYKTLTVQYWTHTAGGVTELDFEQAAKVEALLNA